MNKKSSIYAICETCDDFYDIEEVDYPGYCSEGCERNREGSCSCSTSNPPCSWCEGSIAVEPDVIGTLNDIFLWSFDVHKDLTPTRLNLEIYSKK